jgi:hypothetical protein
LLLAEVKQLSIGRVDHPLWMSRRKAREDLSCSLIEQQGSHKFDVFDDHGFKWEEKIKQPLSLFSN